MKMQASIETKGYSQMLPETDSAMAKQVLQIQEQKEKIEDLHAQMLRNVDSITNSVVGTMATFPGREDITPFCIESVLPQLDKLVVFLNSYTEPPEYLGQLSQPEKVVPLLSNGLDLSALGKTFALDLFVNCTVFSLDDDLLYPSNYIHRMEALLEGVKRSAVVAAHGSILAWPLSNYYERESRFPFNSKLNEVKFCTLAGSGHLCFCSKSMPMSFWDFYPYIMVDLQYAICARKLGFPIIVVPHRANWLMEIAEESGLFDQMKYRSRGRTYHYYKAKENGPWNIDEFDSMYRKWFNNLRTDGASDTSLITVGSFGVVDSDVQNYLLSGKPIVGWSVADQRRTNRGMISRGMRWIFRGRLSKQRLKTWIREILQLVGGEPLVKFARLIISGISTKWTDDNEDTMRSNYQKLTERNEEVVVSTFLSDKSVSAEEHSTSSARRVKVYFDEVSGFRGRIILIRVKDKNGDVVNNISGDIAYYGKERVLLIPPQKRKPNPGQHSVVIECNKSIKSIELIAINQL